jgi:tetratricopeptide (TPR) repeat protein
MNPSMFHTLPGRFLLILSIPILAGALLVSSSAQHTDSQVEKHFLAAQQDQQQGQLDAAAQEYEEVLRLQPGLPEAYVNLGLVYYAQAKFDKSAGALAVADKLRPGMRGVDLWLGIDDVKLNRPVQGAALLRAAVRMDPTNKLAQSWLGTALWNTGQTNAALLQLRKAATGFPDDPDVIFALSEAFDKAASEQTEQLLDASQGTSLSDLIYGTIYAEQHEWPKAEGHLRRAIERDPSSLDARLKLAEVYFEQGNLAAAQEQLDQARALAPRSAAVLARSGELLLFMKQPAEGLARIETALKIDPSETLDGLGLPAENHIGGYEAVDKFLPLCRDAVANLEADPTPSPARNVALAALYALAGDEDASLQAYRRIGAFPSGPSPSGNLFAQALVATHHHRYEVAEATLLRWLAVHPDDPVARYDLILARRHISMDQLLQLLSIAPDSYHVHQMLGQLYISRDEDNKALAEYLVVAAAQPDLPGVHFWLGHLYWKLGDTDHATAELTRELELNPGHPEASGELGTILVAQGHAAEAIPYLESAIHSKPDLWPVYQKLSRAYALEKQYERAEVVLKPALTHDSDGTTHYQLGLVLRAEGKTAQATQAFAEVRAIKTRMDAPTSTNNAASEATTQ